MNSPALSATAAPREHDSIGHADYDYVLPRELIARYPTGRRDASRLMIIGLNDRIPTVHSPFGTLPELMNRGDVLVANDSKVIPARLLGRKPTGATVEILLLRPVARSPANPHNGCAERRGFHHGGEDNYQDAYLWQALVRPGRRLKPGHSVLVGGERGLRVEIEEMAAGGVRVVRLRTPLPAMEVIERFGTVPLPPYLGRDAEALDKERYQTVYASTPGSVAAPTAGLHFSTELLALLEDRGIEMARLTLHVGAGTFRGPTNEVPATSEIPASSLNTEFFNVPESTARMVNEARDRGRRVWAVGTTTVRALESAFRAGEVRATTGTTNLFIAPPHTFRAVDALVTNFHLPHSSLLMLVAAFGGRGRVLDAYREAVALRYRFYSYGDAMAIH